MVFIHKRMWYVYVTIIFVQGENTILITLDNAIQLESVVKLHTVSGEFYEGVCTHNVEKLSYFNIRTEKQTITLPRWSVKKIWKHTNK